MVTAQDLDSALEAPGAAVCLCRCLRPCLLLQIVWVCLVLLPCPLVFLCLSASLNCLLLQLSLLFLFHCVVTELNKARLAHCHVVQ